MPCFQHGDGGLPFSSWLHPLTLLTLAPLIFLVPPSSGILSVLFDVHPWATGLGDAAAGGA